MSLSERARSSSTLYPHLISNLVRRRVRAAAGRDPAARLRGEKSRNPATRRIGSRACVLSLRAKRKAIPRLPIEAWSAASLPATTRLYVLTYRNRSCEITEPISTQSWAGMFALLLLLSVLLRRMTKFRISRGNLRRGTSTSGGVARPWRRDSKMTRAGTSAAAGHPFSPSGRIDPIGLTDGSSKTARLHFDSDRFWFAPPL